MILFIFLLWTAVVSGLQPRYFPKEGSSFIARLNASISSLSFSATNRLNFSSTEASLSLSRGASRTKNSSDPVQFHSWHSTHTSTSLLGSGQNITSDTVGSSSYVVNRTYDFLSSTRNISGFPPQRPNVTTAPASINTCPKSYNDNHTIDFRTLDLCADRDAELGSLYLYKSYSDRCLASYCQSSYDAETTRISTWPGWFYLKPYHNVTLSNGEITSTQDSTFTNISWTWYSTFRSYQPPCCGACSIYPHSVHVYFWPEQTVMHSPNELAPPASTYVDESGYTFVSPSIYMGLSTFSARDACGLIGTIIPSTTIAFDISELSTIAYGGKKTCLHVSENTWGSSTLQPFSLLTRPLTLSDLMRQNCTVPEFPDYNYNASDSNNFLMPFDPCHPYFLLPQKVKLLQAGWSTCITQLLPGLYDPPKTLHPGAVLVPTTTPASVHVTVPPTPAQPIPSPPQQTDYPSYPSYSTNNPDMHDSPETSREAAHSFTSVIAGPTIQIGPGPLLTIVLQNPIPASSFLSGPQLPQETNYGPTDEDRSSTMTLAQPSRPIDPSITASIHGGGMHTDPAPSYITITLPPEKPSEQSQSLVLTRSTSRGARIVIISGQILSQGTTATIRDDTAQITAPTRINIDPSGVSATIILGTFTTVVKLDTTSTESVEPSGYVETITKGPNRIFEFHHRIYSMDRGGLIMIEGQTLTPGGVVTVDGTRLSLDPAATEIVVGQDANATIMLTTITDEAGQSRAVETLSSLGYTVYGHQGSAFVVFVKGDSTITIWLGATESGVGATVLTSNVPAQDLNATTTSEVNVEQTSTQDAGQYAEAKSGDAIRLYDSRMILVPEVVVIFFCVLFIW